ncbi:MAG: methionyl-tRNA formyltransferase [Acidobacteriota bacterium]
MEHAALAHRADLRIVFFGTPAFAVPTLEGLVAAGYRPLRVISQPSRPAGRGRRQADPPVVDCARAHDLDVVQAASVKDEAFLDALRALAPDVAVVVAFGQIFRRPLLALPRFGCINLHASLLPHHRGAAPIQAAIAAGDDVTGVTTMQMGPGLDDGPMLRIAETPIGADETHPQLAARLADIGATLMVETLDELRAGRLDPIEQDHDRATHAPRLRKEDGRADWTRSASALDAQRRGYEPWPGLTATLDARPLKLRETCVVGPAALRAADLDAAARDAQPGTLLGLVTIDGDRSSGASTPLIAVACGPDAPDGAATALGLRVVQRPGRRLLDARDLWNGERLAAGQRFARAGDA